MSVFGVRMTIRRGELLVRLLPARSLKSRERERESKSKFAKTLRKDNPDMESIKVLKYLAKTILRFHRTRLAVATLFDPRVLVLVLQEGNFV